MCEGGFNSTLVRLEDFKSFQHCIFFMFQFHFGSIGSFLPSMRCWRSLKFQFHFGSIGSVSGTFGKYSQQSFNSTLVRLEAIPKASLQCSNAFQFHFGSIGRVNTWRLQTRWPVSIPLWFDWKPIPLELYGQAEYVSIPLWFDWKKKPQQMQETPKQVSIPLWFDWKVSPCAKLY